LRHQFFCAQAVLEGMRKIGRRLDINFGFPDWLVKTGGMPATRPPKGRSGRA